METLTFIPSKKVGKISGYAAKIYYKYEGVSPTGSHKPNTAVPQAFFNQQEGVKKIYTETGAGQWGEFFGFCRPNVWN
jgi:tryptophan synthase beta chain